MCTMEGEDKMSTVDNDFRINVTEHDRAIKKKKKRKEISVLSHAISACVTRTIFIQF